MNTEQFLAIIDSGLSKAVVTRAEHQQYMQAIGAFKEILARINTKLEEQDKEIATLKQAAENTKQPEVPTKPDLQVLPSDKK